MNYSGAQVYNSTDINTEDKNGIKNSYIRYDIWIWASKQLPAKCTELASTLNKFVAMMFFFLRKYKPC